MGSGMKPPWHSYKDACTGTHCAEVWVSAPEGPYPPMVHLEIEAGPVLAPDAREYALMLLAAAEVADAL
jgi:hypothetical protein